MRKTFAVGAVLIGLELRNTICDDYCMQYEHMFSTYEFDMNLISILLEIRLNDSQDMC